MMMKIVMDGTLVRKTTVMITATARAYTSPRSRSRLIEKADKQTVRLPALAFLELRELDRRGCTIPQVWDAAKPVNVIKFLSNRLGSVVFGEPNLDHIDLPELNCGSCERNRK
jgi:hypothetical protein